MKGSWQSSGRLPCAFAALMVATAPLYGATADLTVVVAGTGSGTITSVPAGIDCGAVCAASFAGGTSVTLGAVPASGSRFLGWSGEGCGGAGICVVTMDQARTVTASFEAVAPELVVGNVGPGTGTVTSSPAGISCPGTCSARFATGTTVMLTAVPDAGFELASWSGDCSGTGTCTVVMDGSRCALAAYKPIGDLYTIRHHFVHGGDDGQLPGYGQPVSDRTYLYGTASGGGAIFDLGVVYRMRLDGSEYTTLHRFSGAGDGSEPSAAPSLDNNVLYGMTTRGGAGGLGTIFRIDPDGSGFAVLHSFAAGTDDGAYPYGSLTIADGVLYGMTRDGGDSDLGTVFRINQDGSGFAVLHVFAGGADDGAGPFGSLTNDGGELYGMTYRGGGSDLGTIFKINANGSAFSVLHSFAGGTDDGAGPYGSLTVDNSVLYGMTRVGGSAGLGTVFKINPDGSAFSVLHSFAGTANDGAYPLSWPGITDGVLYGTTLQGGVSGRGVIFLVNTDGSGFAVLHSFTGGALDGANPASSLAIIGGALYGTTVWGGPSNTGSVFKINPDGSAFALLHSFVGRSSDSTLPNGRLELAGGKLYGTSRGGGASGLGTLFTIDPDGSGFAVLHSFAGGADDGAVPRGSLTLAGGVLYGMTGSGGGSDLGTVFRINADGSGFSVLRSFSGGADDGEYPFGSLTADGGALYGMTYAGGSVDLGTVFRIDPDGSGFAVLHVFAGGADDGAHPYGSLAINGGVLYGMTFGGGTSDLGTVFRISPDGAGFVVLHSFSGGTGDGAKPRGSLTVDGGVLYGTTSGGSTTAGTIFKVNADGSGFAVLHAFGWGGSFWPYGSLTLDNGELYGMAFVGGATGNGTIFKLRMDGSRFAVLHSFAGGPSDGRNPEEDSAVRIVGGALYGTTPVGGASEEGTLFSLERSFEISGTVSLGAEGMGSVTMVGLPGDPDTDASGHYTATVPWSWSGTVTPTLAGYAFDPPTRTHANVQSDQIDQDYTATPVYPLTVAWAGNGSGAVTSSPTGIDCGLTCTTSFPAGTEVTLSADADSGSLFLGWSGEGCSGVGTCVVTMDRARGVIATFEVPGTPMSLFVVTPCRVLDTRTPSGAPILAAGERRVFTVAGKCGVPSGAKAIVSNLTVVGAGAQGELKVIAGHLTATLTSSISFSPTRARANNAIVQLATDGSGTISVINNSTGTVHFILDVSGYFQ